MMVEKESFNEVGLDRTTKSLLSLRNGLGFQEVNEGQ
jgi:hypothetical protein